MLSLLFISLAEGGGMEIYMYDSERQYERNDYVKTGCRKFFGLKKIICLYWLIAEETSHEK